MTSFLGGHGKKQRVLPALGIVQSARADEFPVNAGRDFFVALGLGIHEPTMPCDAFAGKLLREPGLSLCAYLAVTQLLSVRGGKLRHRGTFTLLCMLSLERTGGDGSSPGPLRSALEPGTSRPRPEVFLNQPCSEAVVMAEHRVAE